MNMNNPPWNNDPYTWDGTFTIRHIARSGNLSAAYVKCGFTDLGVVITPPATAGGSSTYALSLLNPITTVVNLFNLDGTIAVDGNGASKLNPDKATNLNSYWKVKGINHLLFMQAAN
jgi:hypothetical protein